MTKQWFVYASRDLRAASGVFAMGSEYKNIAAFNCQQCVEKAMKGFLVYNEQRPPKSHSIKDLAALVSTIDSKFAKKLVKADILTKYAVVYRYPLSFFWTVRLIAVAWLRMLVILVPGPLIAFLDIGEVMESVFVLIWGLLVILPIPTSKASQSSVWERLGRYRFKTT